MDRVALKALAKNPADRYQTAHEMYEDIARLLAGQKVQAVVPPAADDTPTQLLGADDQTQLLPDRGAATAKLPSRGMETEEEAPSHLGRIIGIVVGVMLVISLVAVGVVWALNKNTGDTPPTEPSATTVQVPQVVTMNEAAAIQAIKNKGLQAQVVDQYGPDDGTKERVISQNPPEGSQVAPGSTVEIVINRGPELFAVPDVTGMKQADAEALMKQTFSNVTTQPATEEGPDAEIGTIIKQDPSGGMAPSDKAITLYVATGEVKLPPLVGFSKDSALMKLGALGFNTDLVKFTYQPSDLPPDQILRMEPQAGTSVARDSTIQLWVAVPIVVTTPPPSDTTSPSPTDQDTGQ